MKKKLFLFLLIFCFTEVLFHDVFGETITKPQLIDKPQLPPLPKALKRGSAKGTALIRIRISRTGELVDRNLIRTTGSKILDEFLLDWVSRWRFLPRMENGKPVPGFTVVSIRYDLQAGRFDAPSPIDVPMEIPDELITRTSHSKEEPSSVNAVEPEEPLKIGSIPLAIQSKALSGERTLYLEVNEKRIVTKVHWGTPAPDEQFRTWMESFLKTVKWKPVSVETRDGQYFIALPVQYETHLCKVVFSDAYLVETLPEGNETKKSRTPEKTLE